MESTPKVSLWKEDALAAALFLLWMYGTPLLVLSLDKVRS